MSTSKTEVLAWAERVISRKTGPAHLLLEVRERCTVDEAQAAFHKIARTAHPDLHRQGLDADELEKVTSAYAAVAGAYMTLRSEASNTDRLRKLEPTPPVGSPAAPSTGRVPTTRTPPAGVPRPSGPPAADAVTVSHADAAQAMSSKALTYFRKAESGLKRGDLKGAVLQIKLAIAADPTSAFLRNALAEIDAELRKPT